MASISRLAPPDPALPIGATTVPSDDDQTAWLITFSDLVLQLFAFVLVAMVLGNAQRPSPEPRRPARVAEERVAEALPLERAARPEPLPPPPATHDVLPLPVLPPPVLPLPVAPPPAPLAGTEPEPVLEPAPPPPDATATQRTALEGYLRELAGRADGVAVSVHDADVVLTLSDTIAFPSGRAELLPGALPILGAIRGLVASLPGFTIQVEGHTDDVQIHTAAFPSNLDLSLARAARVAHELSGGDPALVARTAASGFGEHHPVAPNADEAGRARNRRVEIRLVRREPPAG